MFAGFSFFAQKWYNIPMNENRIHLARVEELTYVIKDGRVAHHTWAEDVAAGELERLIAALGFDVRELGQVIDLIQANRRPGDELLGDDEVLVRALKQNPELLDSAPQVGE